MRRIVGRLSTALSMPVPRRFLRRCCTCDRFADGPDAASFASFDSCTWKALSTRSASVRSKLFFAAIARRPHVAACSPDLRAFNSATNRSPENPSPEELRAAHRRADKRIQLELGAALELVELGDVATIEYLEKQAAIRDRLDAIIARLYKKLAFVRAIKSMPPPSLPAPAPLLLENAA